MPRKTKAERERIKVTCLWCENEARTHLICVSCMAPMTDNERKQYVRVLPIDCYTKRKCACGAEIPDTSPAHTLRCSACSREHNKQQLKMMREKLAAEWKCADCKRESLPPYCRQCRDKRNKKKRASKAELSQVREIAREMLRVMKTRASWKMHDLRKALGVRYEKILAGRDHLIKTAQVRYNMNGLLEVTS